MTIKSLGNPFDGDQTLIHSKQCGCPECKAPGTNAVSMERRAPAPTYTALDDSLASSGDSEEILIVPSKAPWCARFSATTITAVAAL
jgi:nitrate/nitrite transport system substrate-binding protein